MGRNDEIDRIGELFLRTESPRFLGSHTKPPTPAPFSSPQAYSKPRESPYVSSPTATSRSSGSRSSFSRGSDSDKSSRRSSESSAPSLNPPWQTLNQAQTMAPYHYGYDLACEFSYTGCNLRFYPGNYEAWIDHTTSHFGRHPPPLRTICTFCDQEFDCSHTPNDASRTWRRRLEHIGAHFQERAGAGEVHHERPDFWTVDHMLRMGLISKDDYAYATRYSERPHCDNTYPLGYKPGEMLAVEDRSSRASYDQAKEDRRRRKEKGSGRSSKGKGRTY